MRTTIAVLLTLAVIGCGTPRMMTTQEYQERPTIEQSLFKGDELSEDNIQRMLAGKIKLPSKAKIALLKYDAGDEASRASRYYGYYYWRSEDYLKLQQQFVDTLQSNLLGSGRIAEATVLPSMLFPAQPSITALRQAAVRMQADLLLLYRLHSDVYSEYIVFGKDKVKAYSTCELVLLDTRTGIIPFTTVATREMLSREESGDLNTDEAMRRVQRQASLETLTTVSKELADFMKAVP